MNTDRPIIMGVPPVILAGRAGVTRAKGKTFSPLASVIGFVLGAALVTLLTILALR